LKIEPTHSTTSGKTLAARGNFRENYGQSGIPVSDLFQQWPSTVDENGDSCASMKSNFIRRKQKGQTKEWINKG